MPMRKIDISEETFQLLQKFAIPLEDTPDSIIRKLAEQASRATAGQSLKPAPKIIQLGQPRQPRGARNSWRDVNFRLPNIDISEIWGMSRQAVANQRSNRRMGTAAWMHSSKPTGDYLTAVQEERTKVALRISPPRPVESTEEMMGT